ncbi:neuromedin-K receptor isoform X2 [Parasteatoda tepidariorum]|uniref:neuromedin-K receptor isoform X2 n=1 Tax=Parasteatoda tepidariorum TaxID=114398 RepID=UPI001C722B5E|nr:neuromedin-K receptor [Parasteatoda tepidariorum]
MKHIVEDMPQANFSIETINLTLDAKAITNETHYVSDLYEVPLLLIVFLSCCYGLISILSIVGNFSVIVIVALSRRMQNVTNYFIANLAVADMIIGLFVIPFHFQAALLQRWVLPPFMCAFCPFIQVLSVNVSVFSLAAIALDRYRAVVHPLKAKTTKLRAKWIILFIWIFSALISVPYAVALRVKMVFDSETGAFTKPFCHNIGISASTWKVYNHILVFLQYLVPLFLISLVYITIGLRLKATETPGNEQGGRDVAILKNRKKVIHMMFIVVTLFGVCWLPLQLYNAFQEILPEINRYRYINLIWFGCHWLAMSNSCYNPFIYAIYNEKFNSEFRSRFGCCMKVFCVSQPNNVSSIVDTSSSRYT